MCNQEGKNKFEEKEFSLIREPVVLQTPYIPPKFRTELTAEFLIGLIEGDGCFGVTFKANAKIEVYFHITQDLDNIELLEMCNSFQGNVGSITKVDLDQHKYSRYNMHGQENYLRQIEEVVYVLVYGQYK